MQYQLVLQFRGDSFDEYEAMIALEDELVDELSKNAVVDGHDMGCGEVNIFILTSNPISTFEESKAVLNRRQLLNGAEMTAAFRPILGDDFTVLWPSPFHGEFAVA